MAKVKVLRQGNDNCKASGSSHLQQIGPDLVGRCRCGRAVAYGQAPMNWLAAAQAAGGRKGKGRISPKKGIPTAEYERQGNNRRPVGSANEASNAWNSGVAKSERALVKGGDF